jgi:hypothetical protein
VPKFSNPADFYIDVLGIEMNFEAESKANIKVYLNESSIFI